MLETVAVVQRVRDVLVRDGEPRDRLRDDRHLSRQEVPWIFWLFVVVVARGERRVRQKPLDEHALDVLLCGRLVRPMSPPPAMRSILLLLGIVRSGVGIGIDIDIGIVAGVINAARFPSVLAPRQLLAVSGQIPVRGVAQVGAVVTTIVIIVDVLGEALERLQRPGGVEDAGPEDTVGVHGSEPGSNGALRGPPHVVLGAVVDRTRRRAERDQEDARGDVRDEDRRLYADGTPDGESLGVKRPAAPASDLRDVLVLVSVVLGNSTHDQPVQRLVLLGDDRAFDPVDHKVTARVAFAERQLVQAASPQ